MNRDRHGPRAKRVTDHAEKRPKIATNAHERKPVFKHVGLSTGRIPVRRRIDGDDAETSRR
jgi:hypothetical protein